MAELKKFTKEEFDAFPFVSGRRQCPTGDYTAIKKFPGLCSFGKGCSFGPVCSFGEGCAFGKRCAFGKMCSFGEWCVFGCRCSFGRSCSFGEWCSFGERCVFGKNCSFGPDCSFGDRCSFRGHKAKPGVPFLQTSGGSINRTTLWFNFEDSIRVECGCFFGTLKKFRAQVVKTHGENKFARQYLSQAATAEDFFKE